MSKGREGEARAPDSAPDDRPHATCVLPADVVAAIAAGLAPLHWGGPGRDRVRASLPVRDGDDAMRVQRADEGRWHALLPRVALKPLRIDRAARTQTTLWKLEPGARIPAHEHGAEEECLILAGAVEYEGARYHAGDYLLAKAGSPHHEIASADGATLLIRGELTPHLEALFAP